MATRKIHRTDGPKEIGLKNFYSLTELERKTHIDALQSLEFYELSETDIGVVYFWYQNWMLSDWPNRVKNFLSIKEVDATIRVENSIKEIMFTPTEVFEDLPDDFEELMREIPTYTKSELKELISTIFKNNYSNWEFDLRSTTATKFIDATNNIYKFNEFEKELIREYSHR